MTQKTLFAVLGFVLISSLIFFASDAQAKPKTDTPKSPGRIKIGETPPLKAVRIEPASSYVPSSRERSYVGLGADVFSASQSPGLQIGITTHDIQHYGRMNRQVDWRGGQHVHFAWTVQSDFYAGGDAGTAYEVWDPFYAHLWFEGIDGGIDIHARLGVGHNYSEFAGLDVATDNRVVIVNQHNTEVGTMTTLWPDFSSAAGFFSPYQSRIPDSVAEYGLPENTRFIWPSMEWQVIGDDTVAHVFAHEQTISGETGSKILRYFRKIGDPDNNVWDYPPLSVDTTPTISGTVTASRYSQKMALVWLANPGEIPGDPESYDRGLPYLNDVYYMISPDMGQSWMPKINVTQWDATQPGWAAQSDLSALISTDDNLHIIWNARETEPDPFGSLGYFPHFYGSRLFHWDEFNSIIRTIKDANWDPPFTEDWCHGGEWNEMSIVKMQISECENKFYALFVQYNDIYGGVDDDCHERAFSNNERSGTANGELYISISDNDGLNWDMAWNLTNSYTAHCDSAPALGGT
ncbi:MAG: hypothetical protein JSV44_03355, partial [Candidatus Zixiibacteriota bacterium]